MNAIQKFKQGRKLIKFQTGGTFTGVTTPEGYKIYKRPSKDGGGYYYIDNTPQKFSHRVSPDDFQKYSRRVKTFYYTYKNPNHSGEKTIVTDNGVVLHDAMGYTGNGYYNNFGRPKSYYNDREYYVSNNTSQNNTSQNSTQSNTQSNTQTTAPRQTQSNQASSSAQKKSITTVSHPTYYTSNYKGKVPEKLSSRDAVSNFQEKYLKDYYAPGTYIADGIWGDNTQAAYDRYLAALAQNVQPTAVVETPVVTPEVEVPVVVQEYRPGIYNNEGYIPMAGSYTNVNGLYDYIINNPTSREAMLFNNAYGNLFNRELFDRIMNQYGISGHLGRRDTKRLNGLLDLLKQIGTEGSNEREDFIKTINNPSVLYNRNGGLLSKNPVQRFKLKRGGKFFKY